MREIKFRVWNGMKYEYDIQTGKFGTFYVNPMNNGLDVNDSASLSPFNTKLSEEVVLEQFTGLLDKHQKEIYEGDVVVFSKKDYFFHASPYQPKAYECGDKFVVKFLASGFTLCVMDNLHTEPNIVGNVNNYDFWNLHMYFEVVGNIHDKEAL